jgi:hypothetical protein
MDKGSVGNEDAQHIDYRTLELVDSKVFDGGIYHSEVMGFCALPIGDILCWVRLKELTSITVKYSYWDQ